MAIWLFALYVLITSCFYRVEFPVAVPKNLEIP